MGHNKDVYKSGRADRHTYDFTIWTTTVQPVRDDLSEI